MADDCPVVQCCLPSHRDVSHQPESQQTETTKPDTFDSFGQTSSESIPTLLSAAASATSSHQDFHSATVLTRDATKPSVEFRGVVPLDVVPTTKGSKPSPSSTTRGSVLAPTTMYPSTQTEKLFFFASNPAGSRIDQSIISSYISTTHGTSNAATSQTGSPGQPGPPGQPGGPPGDPDDLPGGPLDKHGGLPGQTRPPGFFGFGPVNPRDAPRLDLPNDFEAVDVPPSLDNRGINLDQRRRITPKKRSASVKSLLTSSSNTVSGRLSPTKTTTSNEVGLISRNT